MEEFKLGRKKAHKTFELKEIDKCDAYKFVKQYHYLGSAKFFAVFSYGLFHDNELVGVATYSNPQGISALKGWFSLNNQDSSVLELSRLCMIPYLNGSNATSYLLGRSMRQLKTKGIRAVITLADNNRHIGSIYQVCNFKYYGLTGYRTDFYTEDGRKNPRGTTKDVRGVWLPRTQKHRYAMIFDDDLICNYKEKKAPDLGDHNDLTNCYYCKGREYVHDDRFNVTYECPKCNDKGYKEGLTII